MKVNHNTVSLGATIAMTYDYILNAADRLNYKVVSKLKNQIELQKKIRFSLPFGRCLICYLIDKRGSTEVSIKIKGKSKNPDHTRDLVDRLLDEIEFLFENDLDF